MTLDHALDTLFASPPESFIAERDRLAKELKAAGEKDAAAALKAQHKPTQLAAALNRLVREQRSLLEQLLEVGRAMAGGKGDFRAELARQRALMQELTAKAAALAGADAHALTAVVQGAMASPELAAQLLRGRFSKLPDVPVGFFGAPPAVAAPAVAPPQVEKEGPREQEHAAAERAAAAHAAALAAAELAADDAQREADRLEAAAHAAQEAATKAKHAHAEALKRAKHLAEQAKKLEHR